MQNQWVKLSFGWLNLCHVAAIEEQPGGGLRLLSALTQQGGGAARILSDADSKTLQSLLASIDGGRAR